LDFGSILAITNAGLSSVIQIRTQNVLPAKIGLRILKSLTQFHKLLESGALIIIDDIKDRARILPLNK
jgi:predicted nuclease of predicted toxin-antitoxin system